MSVEGKHIALDPGHPVMTPFPRAPGEFRFETMGQSAAAPPAPGQRGRFNFGCPLGHGNCGSIWIVNGKKPPENKVWAWDGNIEKPTLHPSINCLSHNPENPAEKYAGCGWHGWLREGVFSPA